MTNIAPTTDAKIINQTSLLKTNIMFHIDIFLVGNLISNPIDSEENGLEKSTALFRE